MTAAEAAVQAAEAVLRQATSTYKRQKALLAQGFATKREHDQAEEAYRTAEASLDAARAQLRTARDELSYTVLRASVAGVITARNAEMGQVVPGGAERFLYRRTARASGVPRLEFVFSPRNRRPAIELTLVSDPEVNAKGSVREVSPTVDTSSGTVRVRSISRHPPVAMTLGAAVVGEGRLRPASWWSSRGARFQRKRPTGRWTVDHQTKTVR